MQQKAYISHSIEYIAKNNPDFIRKMSLKFVRPMVLILLDTNSLSIQWNSHVAFFSFRYLIYMVLTHYLIINSIHLKVFSV
jgi:hypothetical protein